MNRIKLLTSCLLIISAVTANSSDIKLSLVEFDVQNWRKEDEKLSVKLTIEWNNAWNNKKNHDAAWVFFKIGRSSAGNFTTHALLAADGHEVMASNGVEPEIDVPSDRVGFFIYPKENYRGNVRWTLRMRLDPASFQRLSQFDIHGKAFALEMVYIPRGGFTLGDPDTRALEFGAFFKSDAEGKPSGLIDIKSEDEVAVGPQEGSLYYIAGNPAYQGDQQGPVPATFPKGFEAFYIMKYETTQGQYANFLNTLSSGQTMFRANFGVKGYYKNRGSIYIDKDVYMASAPDRPANYISWDDGLAFADWAGLRPMTEFEFTKASRGPGKPVANEFPWGSGNKSRLSRTVNHEDNLVMTNGWDQSMLDDSNRDVFGASYFWVMDLAGSVWERVVSIGHENGRAFIGSHGDGRISGQGFATNEDWPQGDVGSGGFGYRGGGYYEHNRPATEFNPHSPIAYRRFGAWAGGNRSIAYSNRYVRSAE